MNDLCPKENLPMFATMDEMNTFIARFCPSVKQVEKWKCDVCGAFHLYAVAASPGGDSSGQGRNSKWKTREEWQAFFRAKSPAEMLRFLPNPQSAIPNPQSK